MIFLTKFYKDKIIQLKHVLSSQEFAQSTFQLLNPIYIFFQINNYHQNLTKMIHIIF